MKTKREILKEHLLPVFGDEKYMEEQMCNNWEEIEAAIDDYIEQLNKPCVSKQRELLIAFSQFVVKNVTVKGHEEVVDFFLKSNL